MELLQHQDLIHWEHFLDSINSTCYVPNYLLEKALPQNLIQELVNKPTKSQDNLHYIQKKSPLSLRYMNDALPWFKILSSHPAAQTITELCPGSSVVIPLALSYAGYTGRFCKIDYKNSEVTSDILRRYQAINIDGNLLTSPEIIPSSDIIILNHAIDDLFIGLWAAKHQEPYFERFDVAHVDYLNTCWQRAICEEAEFYPVLADFFKKLPNHLNQDGIIIVRDYPSSYETWQKDLDRINFTRSLTTKLVQEMLDTKSVKLQQHDLDAIGLPEPSLLADTFFIMRKI